ncbi:lysophospholipid acyltransferase [Luteipulveratus mongoliensis]|uniref:Glycerol-3-phosphate acyltransferase n=1 Tax=Luteipulveratus mongoliensis TaxID=571913 RepID=A0A0K1JNP4_9MICO|nr:lysophospholipid acyltransferase [Luteipulveratus mongoliensis]AKU18337.1 glycerol-3-phosphate acyltransferase [Luteipulveratus mongoliensis]
MRVVPESAAITGALDRVHARGVLQHAGLIGESLTPLASDSREVAELLVDPAYDDTMSALAAKLGQDETRVREEAAQYLREMSATHSDRASESFRKFGQWMMRAHDVFVDDDSISRLRSLDRQSSLLFLFSHRSYLDGAMVPEVLASRGISPAFTFAGANLNFFPMGSVVSRSGGIFIRRDTHDLPVYRGALRAYIGQLVRNRANLAWSIEGGRTRTGKLRPPVFGIMRYVVDAVDALDQASDGTGAEAHGDALVVPVSIVYDQLHEVARMTTEARGGNKRPEDLRWLVQFARDQRQRLGRAYLDFGEPFSLRDRLGELSAGEAPHLVERIALDTCHRINRATPVTATAIVSLAMLGVDRALSLGEVMETIEPLVGYLDSREWPVAGAANLTDRSTVRRALQELVASDVLTCYEGGTETVWRIGRDTHLIAAFYRNTAIHVLVERAIGELALLAAAEKGTDPGPTVREEALRLRELLKFDFFFSSRGEFGDELEAELRRFDSHADAKVEVDPGDLRQLLQRSSPHVAHLVLRPFLDAYHVVADRLVTWEDQGFDEKRFLDECLRVGRQWALQRRVASDESISLELFRTALRLAAHRDLLESDSPHLTKRREDFLVEIREAARRAGVVAEMARTHR